MSGTGEVIDIGGVVCTIRFMKWTSLVCSPFAWGLMRNRVGFGLTLWLVLLTGLGACTIQDARIDDPPLVTATPPGTNTPLPPTATSEPTPTPLPTLTPTATAVPRDLSLEDNSLFLYPIPNIYSGDLVTFQVLPHVPDNVNPANVNVLITVDGEHVASGVLAARNLGGQVTGLFPWAWDTTGLVGTYEVAVILDPDNLIQIGDENPGNNLLVRPVEVLSARKLPGKEVGATWVTAESACCTIHAISGTAAYRDLPQLIQTIETAVEQARRAVRAELNQKLDIYLIDRVIGQGGYAADSMVISYLDRQYSGRGLHQVIVHETVHVLDRQFAPRRLTFLAEGLAVWATGGHYKPEDLERRAAALLELGQAYPLAQLIDNFYPVQHEIGYLQAGAFVQYLIQRDSWERFKAFYSDTTADDAPTQAEAVDLNLQIYYGRTLAEMEQEWWDTLRQKPAGKDNLADLQTTVRYYDLMRRYQAVYDPTAYYLTAWLPYPEEVRDRGNPADFTRGPQEEVNVVLEVMLLDVDDALRAADYNRANVLLDSIERALDNNGTFLDPLAINYQKIVQIGFKLGLEVQQVSVTGQTAVATLTAPQNNILIRWTLVLKGQEWIITSNQ